MSPYITYPNAAAVTPNDSADLPSPCQALWIGALGTGGLSVITAGGQQVDFVGVPVGLFFINARRVRATGTGVTSIVALW